MLTTCFINPLMLNENPDGFWRFSADGLELLCKKSSKIIDVVGWGNPYVWFMIWAGLRFDGVPEVRWHPLHKIAPLNHPSFPFVTWIIVQK